MKLEGKVAVVTGAASGIGQATCLKLAEEGVAAIGAVDRSEGVREFARSLNDRFGREILLSYSGDVVDGAFRERVFADMETKFDAVHICVPAAGITRDRLAVKLTNGSEPLRLDLYSEDEFRRVMDINLIAPIYWALRTVGSVALSRKRARRGPWVPDERVQGGIVLIGSVSKAGNRGQISYATAKAGLEGAQATLAIEAIFYGVRCAIIHPGFTDTPMVRSLGDDLIREQILPNTQLKRLIRPEEIAEAIVFMLRNSSVSGALWADAGWHPRG
ncbi:MAG: 3-oxoacyl-[acyl-carrier-protein] reductase FabG [Phycisphaerae bacterium]|nr:3-oxoacyl-[acyl-carrier-protein] reductase FabG [Phycisphaerae bacterium]